MAKGLFGALIIRAARPADDPLAGIPDKLLILSDNRFRRTVPLTFRIRLPSQHRSTPRTGGKATCCSSMAGRCRPSIRRGELQRWRIINASAARSIGWDAGRKLLHVGSDGGLSRTPREVDDF